MINTKNIERETMLQYQHVRLKCLKLAVLSGDTEAELDLLIVLGRAQVLFDYVINGNISVMPPADETVKPGESI
jgi:hypothetical protein